MKNANYDLEERTAVFGEAVIDFCLHVRANTTTALVMHQLVRAGTNIGANYCEADDAESKKDFRHKIGICRKEARETKFWLRMIARAAPEENWPRELSGKRPLNFTSSLPRLCAPPTGISVRLDRPRQVRHPDIRH